MPMTLHRSLNTLAAVVIFGTIAIIDGVSGYGGEFPALTLLEETARAVGISVGSRAQLQAMEAFMLKHGVKPPIGRIYPHAQLDEAIAEMRAGQIVGQSRHHALALLIRVEGPAPDAPLLGRCRSAALN